MTVDFGRMRAAGWSPIDCATLAESRGMSRLEVFKAIYTHWGAESLAVEELERYGAAYPSRGARAAATVGLGVLVLNYPTASADDFAAFERSTGISRKVDALARADRTNDALRFYDRLDPFSLKLTPVSEAEARAAVRSIRTICATRYSIVVDSIARYSWGWLFSPQLGHNQATRWLPASDQEARPIIFDCFTGVSIEVETDEPTDIYLRRYEETGWPCPT